MEELELSYVVGGNISIASWEKDLAVSYKTKNTCPYDTVIPLLGMYPRKMKAYDHKQTYIIPFIWRFRTRNTNEVEKDLSSGCQDNHLEGVDNHLEGRDRDYSDGAWGNF